MTGRDPTIGKPPFDSSTSGLSRKSGHRRSPVTGDAVSTTRDHACERAVVDAVVELVLRELERAKGLFPGAYEAPA